MAQYNTGNGQQASTTGNVYGVYDMSGGAWEYVAGYIDNGNNELGIYGTSIFFENNKLRAEYNKYYDIYEPGDQERQGGQYYGSGINTLWNADNSLENNTSRKNLTDATYLKMANRKGDALYEISNGVSYCGKDNNDYIWLKNASDTTSNEARGWNDDIQLYGHGNIPWIKRGGEFYVGISAGVFAMYSGYGDTTVAYGFRPVFVAGASL